VAQWRIIKLTDDILLSSEPTVTSRRARSVVSGQWSSVANGWSVYCHRIEYTRILFPNTSELRLRHRKERLLRALMLPTLIVWQALRIINYLSPDSAKICRIDCLRRSPITRVRATKCSCKQVCRFQRLSYTNSRAINLDASVE